MLLVHAGAVQIVYECNIQRNGSRLDNRVCPFFWVRGQKRKRLLNVEPIYVLRARQLGLAALVFSLVASQVARCTVSSNSIDSERLPGMLPLGYV